MMENKFGKMAYNRLLEWKKIDTTCGEQVGCDECPYRGLYGFSDEECLHRIILELSEVMRTIYDDSKAMEALHDVALGKGKSWNPYPEITPSKNGEYLVQTKNDEIFFANYEKALNYFYVDFPEIDPDHLCNVDNDIVAWSLMPTLYRAKK